MRLAAGFWGTKWAAAPLGGGDPLRRDCPPPKCRLFCGAPVAANVLTSLQIGTFSVFVEGTPVTLTREPRRDHRREHGPIRAGQGSRRSSNRRRHRRASSHGAPRRRGSRSRRSSRVHAPEQFVNAAAPNNGALSRRCDKQRMLERQVALASCTQPLVARSCAARGVSVY